jgi:hypothetical protein
MTTEEKLKLLLGAAKEVKNMLEELSAYTQTDLDRSPRFQLLVSAIRAVEKDNGQTPQE